MHRAKLVSFAALAVVLSGCFSIHRVSTAENSGIPFFARTGFCNRETVWLEPLYTLSLRAQKLPATASEQPQEIAKAELGLTAYRTIKSSNLATLIAGLVGGTIETPAAALAEFQNVVKAAGTPLTGRESDLDLSTNTNAMESGVDYSKRLYYNVKRPWVGTTSSTLKLKADGTIEEATASVEDKTLETISSLIPLKEFLTAELIPAAPDSSETETEPVAYRITLTVTTTIYKHSLSRRDALTANTPGCPTPGDALRLADKTHYQYKREEVGGSGASEKKKDEGKKITLSGEVVLPSEAKPAGG